jgi:hypothetical protein
MSCEGLMDCPPERGAVRSQGNAGEVDEGGLPLAIQPARITMTLQGDLRAPLGWLSATEERPRAASLAR